MIQSGGFRLRVDLRGPGGGESADDSTVGPEVSERLVGSSLGGAELGCGSSSSSGGLGIGCSSDRISCLRLRTNRLSPTCTP